MRWRKLRMLAGGDAAINSWLEELAVIPDMAGHIEPLRAGLEELYRKGDDSPDHAEFFEGVRWIAAHTNKTAIERLEKIIELRRLEGHPVILDMQLFTGWK
jgi:hypothetical protein